MKRLWLSGLALLLVPAAQADVKLHPLFSDGMVLQQEKDCPIWGTADPGDKLTIRFSLGQAGFVMPDIVVDSDGKWQTKLPKLKAGGPFQLEVKGKNNTVKVKEVYVGEIWVASGQSNMQWSIDSSEDPVKIKESANDPLLRFFMVPLIPQDQSVQTVNARWEPTTPQNAGKFSAVAYHFARHLRETRKVPVGILQSAWGGTYAEAWTTREAFEKSAKLKPIVDQYEKVYPQQLKNYETATKKYQDDLEKHQKAVEDAKQAGKTPPPAPQRPGDPGRNPNRPCVLYQGMIAPLQPYAIQGAIWYQGESNAGRAYEYRTLFPTMIQSWRDSWKQGDFPFLFVQLAPWKKIVQEPQESDWAELREAQLLTTKTLRNTGMAVITDLGDEGDIHPLPKAPVGVRLALAARALTYGEKITYSGPEQSGMTIDDNKAIVSFKHVGKGLEARGGELKGFTIAGKDRKFVNAKAEIQGDKVVVWSEQVAVPVAVRFGWANYPVVNLWNKDGLPATPFRTDKFKGVTER